MGKNPILQHYVPQFYLKYFCIPETKNLKNPQVWAFYKEQGNPFKTSVKGIAAQRYLYSPKKLNGERDWETEIKFSNLESLLCSFWDKLANNLFDFENHMYIQKALALFISTLYLRNPQRIIDAKNAHQKTVEYFNQSPEIFNEFFLQGEFKNFKKITEDGHQKIFVESINNHATILAEVLLKKRWSIITTKTPLFITSDSPVVMKNFEKEKYGFNTKGTIIFFPLSPTKLVQIGDWLDDYNLKYYELKNEEQSLYNYLIWVDTNKFMISSRNVDTVLKEINEFANKNEV